MQLYCLMYLLVSIPRISIQPLWPKFELDVVLATHMTWQTWPSRNINARLGVLRAQCFGSDSDPECKAVNTITDVSLSKFATHGAKLIDVEIPNLDRYLTIGSLYGSRSRYDIDKFLRAKTEENGLFQTNVADIVSTKQYPPTSLALEALASGPAYPSQYPEYLQRLESRAGF